eukprot:UN27709
MNYYKMTFWKERKREQNKETRKEKIENVCFTSFVFSFAFVSLFLPFVLSF